MKRADYRKYLLVLILLLTFLIGYPSCKKAPVALPSSYVRVRFAEDAYPVAMQYVTSSYDPHTGRATLDAQGYHFESFHLDLPGLFAPGIYPSPTVGNLAYSVTTNNSDFISDSLLGGCINIRQLDSQRVGGSFRVTLRSTFNGTQARVVTGSFGISAPPF